MNGVRYFESRKGEIVPVVASGVTDEIVTIGLLPTALRYVVGAGGHVELQPLGLLDLHLNYREVSEAYARLHAPQVLRATFESY